jgi:hypothetical protein
MISLDQKVIISSEVLSQEVDGETVLLDMNSENYFGLDEVGTHIWQLLNEDSNLQAVFDTLFEEYEVDENQLEKDLQEYLKQLAAAGLISLT